MQTSPLPQTLRAAAGLALAPLLALAFAFSGANQSGAATPEVRASLMAAYFVAIAVFMPAYLFARRYIDMTGPARLTLLGAFAAWTAPAAYMLLLILWRGDFFDVFVLDASMLLLSRMNVVFGALGGLIFWLVTQASAQLSPRAAMRLVATKLLSRPAPPSRFFITGEI